ncbi:hypothetical protein FDI46_gp166 [Aeromonas phage AS-gz]|uniref:Uncharacterized protein n=4 Tax=Tulanevirus TaxID=2560244 RepID=Q19CW0_9CAUD|nr:hypothetical protein FDI46_gp166 [Aeromonas phage AS-gz]YP_010095541.1 hypothetical protein KNT90_gp058 [Aeromonas phage 50AhydR13PP]YP_656291.1 hypothetical protein PHG25ORF056c [Aeromonas phage 25]QSJ03454.1 hypothetical protein [Aeromonas phage vB_AsM_ZHF]UIW13131.1 hypothetical protein Ah13A_195 [Aeromonas phage AhMtk13a]ABF72615.1 hypothetical protein PHG25ORF056c [Aeromonas phage 25]ASU00702.1 hypothetical protein [Aeromonas phage AS-gz]AWH14805.1 hypothetical protein [Aeromonas pha
MEGYIVQQKFVRTDIPAPEPEKEDESENPKTDE